MVGNLLGDDTYDPWCSRVAATHIIYQTKEGKILLLVLFADQLKNAY